MTLTEIHEDMKRYNGSVAYGSECTAWGDFVDSCHTVLGRAPWEDEDDGQDTEVPEEFSTYWTSVADDKSGDYTDQGDRVS